MSDDFNVSMSGFYVTCAAHVQRLLLERAMILDWLWLQTPLDYIRILIRSHSYPYRKA